MRAAVDELASHLIDLLMEALAREDSVDSSVSRTYTVSGPCWRRPGPLDTWREGGDGDDLADTYRLHVSPAGAP